MWLEFGLGTTLVLGECVRGSGYMGSGRGYLESRREYSGSRSIRKSAAGEFGANGRRMRF